MGFAKGKFCGYETIIANGKTLMSKSAKTLKTNKKSIREVRYKTAKWKTVIFLPHLADVAATAKIDIFV